MYYEKKNFASEKIPAREQGRPDVLVIRRCANRDFYGIV